MKQALRFVAVIGSALLVLACEDDADPGAGGAGGSSPAGTGGNNSAEGGAGGGDQGGGGEAPGGGGAAQGGGGGGNEAGGGAGGGNQGAVHELYIGGSGTDDVFDVSFDAAGNAYVVGRVSDGYVFGAEVVVGTRAFVASYDPSWSLRWHHTWAGTSIYTVEVNAAHACIAGSFNVSVDFGGGQHTSPNSQSLGAVACFDPASGSYQWDRLISVAPFDEVTTSDAAGLAFTTDGQLLVHGSFEQVADFGGGPVVSDGLDRFLAWYDPADGAFIDADVSSTVADEYAFRIALDADGNIYARLASYDAPDLTASVLALDSAGTLRWRVDMPAGGWDGFAGMAFQSNGVVVMAGSFSGALDIGGPVVPIPPGTASFVAGFDPDGTFLWQRVSTPTQFSRLADLVVTPADEIHVIGTFNNTIGFGSMPLAATGDSDVFTASFAADGTFLEERAYGGPAWDFGNGVVVDPMGRSVLWGETDGGIDFGNGPYMGVQGPWDAFVVTLP